MSLIYDVDFNSGTRVLSLLDKAGNVISSCEVPRKSNELTLTATVDNSSVKLTKYGTLSNTFEVDKGNGWEDYAFDTVIPLNAGQSCKWRCSAHPTTQKSTRHVMFVMTGKIEASGNCLSMIQTDMTTPNLIEEYAFFGLFSECSSLTRAPELPVPNYGLNYAYHCFQNMFNWCTSLTKAPELPYTSLVTECFKGMFWGCHNLKEVRISATTTDTDALDGWLGNVSATGDFYCDPNATIFPTGESGIPANWTRRNIADYPN